MTSLKPSVDIDGFFACLARAGQRALFLDYDGTLSPFHQDPAAALPYPGVPEMLERLVGVGHTRVVVVTGRAVNDLLSLLGVSYNLEIWGSHGRERMIPGHETWRADLPPSAFAGFAAARKFAEENGIADWLETKNGALALHYRGRPASIVERIHRKASVHWHQFAEQAGIELRDFDGGIELRVPGNDKGTAVRTVLAEMGQEALVAYLGDDFTDEDGFQAVQGHGLSVLVRDQFRPTAADLWIRPPDELLEFLDRWISVGESPRELVSSLEKRGMRAANGRGKGPKS